VQRLETNADQKHAISAREMGLFALLSKSVVGANLPFAATAPMAAFWICVAFALMAGSRKDRGPKF